MISGRKQIKKHVQRYIIVHIAVYLLVGLLAMIFMDYKNTFMSDPYFDHFRELDSWIVRAAVLFQIVRGALIAIVLIPFYRSIVDSKRGWLHLFGLLFGLTTVLSLPAAPGTIEGLLYTDVSLSAHLIGYPEILLQTFLGAYVYWRWQRRGL